MEYTDKEFCLYNRENEMYIFSKRNVQKTPFFKVADMDIERLSNSD